MRKLWMVSWLLMVTSLAMVAQQPQPAPAGTGQVLPPNAPTREQVLKAMMPRGDRKEQMRSMFDTVKQQFQERGEREGMGADKIKFFGDILDAVLNGISEEELDAIENAMVGVVQRHFTTTELDAIAAFNANSAGEKLKNRQKELVTQMMQAMDPAQLSALATTPLPTNAPSREQLLKLFDAMQMRKTAAAMIGALQDQSKTAIAETLKSHGMDPSVANRSTYNPDHDPSLDRTLNAMMVTYQRFFTASETETMTVFFQSPIGQKYQAATPEIAAEVAKATGPMQRRIMEAVLSKMKEYDEQHKSKSGLIHPNRTFTVK